MRHFLQAEMSAIHRADAGLALRCQACQAVLEHIRDTMRDMQSMLQQAIAQYATALGDDGHIVFIPHAWSSARQALNWLSLDAARRLAHERPSMEAWTTVSLAAARYLDGDDKANALLDQTDRLLLLTAAAQELCSRAQGVDLDADADDFCFTDSKQERSRKRRELAALARRSERCRVLVITFSNFDALCRGVDPPMRSTCQLPRSFTQLSSSSSADSFDSTVHCDVTEERRRHHDDHRASGAQPDLFDDFLADAGPVSF